jgi:hypothetical protein
LSLAAERGVDVPETQEEITATDEAIQANSAELFGLNHIVSYFLMVAQFAPGVATPDKHSLHFAEHSEILSHGHALSSFQKTHLRRIPKCSKQPWAPKIPFLATCSSRAVATSSKRYHFFFDVKTSGDLNIVLVSQTELVLIVETGRIDTFGSYENRIFLACEEERARVDV